MNRYLFFKVILSFIIILSFSACKDDISLNEQTNNLLEGTWDVISYETDGFEQMGTFFTSYRMIFTPDMEETGQTEWALSDFTGSNVTALLPYEILNDGEEILIDSEQSFELDLSGDLLILDGFVDNVRWIIEAERQ